MPKQKTHKSTAKVLKKHPSGLLTYKLSGGNHQTSKDSSKQIRQRRRKGQLAKGIANRLKKVI
ncbi:MAG TPA: 50S ribosomal protein L35 [Bacilli bacterium]|jgi:ribosomal protein L35|nr:50S ribosomal protein L35 [Bacilli bacterium]HPZ24195.1 50S ribosomal protein L35 [Bacilli bacterium]HQC83795.1 50S ribosomal protein L35 [Bacilli bacterium]